MRANERPQPRSEFFSSFIHGESQTRPLWTVPVGLLLGIVVIAVAWLIVRPGPGTYQLMTAQGFRTVSLGMSQSEVGQALGPTVGATIQREGLSCRRYGQPSFREGGFILYEACFDGDVLHSLTPRRYTADPIEPPGGAG